MCCLILIILLISVNSTSLVFPNLLDHFGHFPCSYFQASICKSIVFSDKWP